MARSKLKRQWLPRTVVLLTLILVGCVQVDVVARDDLNSEPTPEQPVSHNLTASGIAFEPPLNEIGRSVLRQGVDLFVEVENNGLHDETEIIIQVTLEAEGQTNSLAQQETAIARIASGESEEAHFRLKELVNLHSHYILHIAVAPCAGETFLLDNQNTFDLHVTSVP
jgi:hypothetical protein